MIKARRHDRADGWLIKPSLSTVNQLRARDIMSPATSVSIDTIDRLSDPLASMSSLPSLVSLLALAYLARVPPPEEQERLTTLMHTISPAPTVQPARQIYVDSFVRFLSPVLNGLAGLKDFTEAVGAYAEPEDFRDFWALEGRNLIKDVVGGSAHTGAAMLTDASFLDVFVKDASLRIALGRRTRALALVPADAEPGDVLWQEAVGGPLTVRRPADFAWSGIDGIEAQSSMKRDDSSIALSGGADSGRVLALS